MVSRWHAELGERGPEHRTRWALSGAAPRRRLFAALLFGLFTTLSGPPAAADAQGCVACHAQHDAGFSRAHGFAATACGACHAGDGTASERQAAHAGLIAHPGHLSNARATCGSCHLAQVEGVLASRMHTGHGVVATTRAVLGEPLTGEHGHGWQGLAQTPADSLLRKLCASCHLGHDRAVIGDGPLHRGGGCLACHLSPRIGVGHARLDGAVSDARCFGCHARSGRISLSYAGLAEAGEEGSAQRARLADGRIVEHRGADAHHRAGMACIDCHAGANLMGVGGDNGVGIVCADCHRRPAATVDGAVVVSGRGVPMPRLEWRAGRLHLRRRLDGQLLAVPAWEPRQHPLQREHARLECDACHATWAPQCHGCHIDYDPDGQQWDHQAGAVTPGRWRERRWGVRNDEPPLGVDENDRIRPFVPGMIFTIAHPDFTAPRFARLFAPLSPHTSGRARSCESCHRSPVALGLGRGTLVTQAGAWSFVPTAPLREDGLPEDAWTGLANSTPGASSRPGARSFEAREIRRILAAPIDAGVR